MSEPKPTYEIIPAASEPLEIGPAHHDQREMLDVWIDTLRSKRTRQEYRKLVSEALAYMGGFIRISPAAIARYHGTLMRAMDDGALSSNSVAVRLSALRSFLSWVGIPDDVLKKNLKRPSVSVSTPYNVLSDDEIERMATACDKARDKTLIYLLRETGARCDELCSIRVSDLFTTDTGLIVLHIRKGKGNKARDVPLSKRAIAQINALLTETKRTIGKDNTYLLQSRQGGRLATSRVRQILINARTVAGVNKRASAHAFRHTAAVRWLRKGRINEVAALLGHESTATTSLYVKHVDIDELARIVDA